MLASAWSSLTRSRPIVAMDGERIISAHSWMEDFFLGVDEETLLSNRANYIDTSGEELKLLRLSHRDGEMAWPAGRFEWPTVASLRARAEADLSSERRAPPMPITVVDGIDIGRLQARDAKQARP